MRGIAKPLELFRSRKPFNDRRADDMLYGDMSEETLKQRYGLIAVSDRVDCYTFKKLHLPAYGNMPILSREQAAARLFDQLRFEASRFAFWGPYTNIVQRMFKHMQYNDGRDFNDAQVNLAYKRVIETNNSKTSTKMLIRDTLSKFVRWDQGLTGSDFKENLLKSHLPKFDRWIDRINGLGISIHEVNSTKITLESLRFEGNKFTAVIHYKGQDHFGLDTTDIQDARFKYLLMFRAWFVLQRYHKLAYKPFLVNMEARITITGEIMLKFSKKNYVMLAILVAIILFFSFHKPSSENVIVTVFDGLVFLKNPPATKESKFEWWKSNESILKSKYHLVPDDKFFTIPIMDFGEGYEKLPHSNFLSGVSEDDYICDDSIKDEKKCIKKESAFTISGDITRKVFIDVGDEMYIQTPDGNTKLVSKN